MPFTSGNEKAKTELPNQTEDMKLMKTAPVVSWRELSPIEICDKEKKKGIYRPERVAKYLCVKTVNVSVLSKLKLVLLLKPSNAKTVFIIESCEWTTKMLLISSTHSIPVS